MTGDDASPPLVPLPSQPPGVPWPTVEWHASAPDGPPDGTDDVDVDTLDRLLDEPFAGGSSASTPTFGVTHALLVVHRGLLVAERYGAGTTPHTTLPSWSLSKSILQAALGTLVLTGSVSCDDRVDHPLWDDDDPRRDLTVTDLLRMRDGLEFREVYEADGDSDVVEMLWGTGRDDVAGFVAAKKPIHAPGERFAYSSGTSNLLASVAHAALGDGWQLMQAYLRVQLFERIGVRSAEPRFDRAGTWIASSYCFITAPDLARIGLLYLRDGVWDGDRVLPEGWVDRARTPQADAVDSDGAWRYGEHWWTLAADPDVFFGHGFRSQVLLADPRRDVLVVRMGHSEPDQDDAVMAHAYALSQCFPVLDAPTA